MKFGGYREDMVAAEDWELFDRLRSASKTFQWTSSKIYHDFGNPTLKEHLIKGAYYGSTLKGKNLIRQNYSKAVDL